jgi:hypothetical protein
MNHFRSLFAFVLFSLFSSSLVAVDIPNVDIGSQHLDQTECVDNNAEDCINDECLTSDDIDCESNCREMAQDKCKQQQDD